MKPSRFRYHTILVATDLGPDGASAYQAALDLGEWIPVERVHLLHVVHLAMLTAETGEGPAEPKAPMAHALAERELQRTRHQLELVVPPDELKARLTREARCGEPAAEIAAVAHSIGADLIVVASHDRGRLGRFIFGSLTDDLIRVSKIPVLVVAKDRPLRLPFERMLAAVDLSPISALVLRHATAMRAAEATNLYVLSTYRGPHATVNPNEERMTEGVEHEPSSQAEAELEKALTSLIAREVEAPVHAEIVIREGTAVDAVRALAKERDIQLVVVGTSGHGAWKRFTEGHTADDVAARAPCPVLVVPQI